MISQRKNTAGFSLVELMMTVSIIGIMAAFVAPSFQSFRLRAHRVEAMANLQVIRSLLAAMENPRCGDFSGGTLDCAHLVGLAEVLKGNISIDDDSGPESCFVNNNFGFRPRDCRRMRYHYANFAKGGDYGNSPLIAIENGWSQFLGASGTGAKSNEWFTANRKVLPGCSFPLPDNLGYNAARELVIDILGVNAFGESTDILSNCNSEFDLLGAF